MGTIGAGRRKGGIRAAEEEVQRETQTELKRRRCPTDRRRGKRRGISKIEQKRHLSHFRGYLPTLRSQNY